MSITEEIAAPAVPPVAHGIKLRPYQREAIKAVRTAFERGVRRHLLVAPTGSGKTIIFSRLAAQRFGRTLFLAHRDELLSQTIEKLTQVMPADEIGLVRATSDDHDKRLVVASVQTLARPQRLARLTKDFRTVIVDEAHHTTAVSYLRILESLGCLAEDTEVLTIGFTATPDRADGVGLGRVFQEIVFERNILDMIAQGYLVTPIGLQVRLPADFGLLHVRAGDFIDSETSELILKADGPQRIVEVWQEHAADRKTVGFAPTVKLAQAMRDAFRAAGVAAEMVWGEQDKDERKRVLADLKSGACRVMMNCGVLTEGWDEPSIRCVIIARPTKSRGLYTQMLGRGLRTFMEKEDCTILDVVGVTSRHDLQTVASLFGVPAQVAGADRPPARLMEQLEDLLEAVGQGEIGEGLAAESVDLLGRVRQQLHWVRVSRNKFALNAMTARLIVVEDFPGVWRVIEESNGTPSRVLADGLSLPFAQGVAEDRARELGPGDALRPDARWRTTRASDRQLSALIKYKIPFDPVTITRGAAADLLTARFAR